ncbi:MAG: formylglycine-generating enzyme family protein [Deltaproteobacteria bacterium]|nr:formylglycine-generating enzyme family protein [Deltaproteobacteria bacterium]
MDWPISFGVVTPEGAAGQTVLLRLRAFRAALAGVEQLGDTTELRPRTEAAIDRLVQLPLSDEEVLSHRVTLSFECFGLGVRFLPLGTCVDAARPAAAPSEGIEPPGDVGATQVGTAELANAVPCGGAPAEGQICIPGGFTLLGDLQIVGIEDHYFGDGVPLQPIYLSPFWLGRTEVTVGQYRAIHGQLQTTPPAPRDPNVADRAECTFLDANDATNDAMPLNCVNWAAAREICQLLGGDLSTEAQWEHAASGRGQSRRSPWGDELATCCVASLDRGDACPGQGPEPVGSHPPKSCDGLGDLSRDGVVDLGGSMAELQLDTYRTLDDDECWAQEGISFDPLCRVEHITSYTLRGGNHSSGLGTALAALRMTYTEPGITTTQGLRCAYEDAP